MSANIVPMNQAVARAAPAAAPAPAPGFYPAQLPFPYPGMGGFPAGCCPPGGMDALMQCYCDIQAAKNFIGKIVLDLMQTDPAFAQAMVQAIADSGAALPLTGVTNGTAAQPGQVGEYVSYASPNLSYNTAATTLTWTAGVLQPGDWDTWAFLQLYGPGGVSDVDAYLNPLPPGFALRLRMAEIGGSFPSEVWLTSPVGQALISVPTLVNFSIFVNQSAPGPSTGQLGIQFIARRVR